MINRNCILPEAKNGRSLAWACYVPGRLLGSSWEHGSDRNKRLSGTQVGCLHAMLCSQGLLLLSFLLCPHSGL